MNKDQDIINKNFAGCLILEKVGQGGMGSVYKAKHLTLNKTVCVKLLSRELSYDQRNIEFFMREARSAAKLDHPNIVHVYNFGEENGQYFIVMSYVEGKTLQDVLNEKKVLGIPEASEIIIEILEGLAHAHSKSIIHRDIKPSNILITTNGVPRIADFGLARSVNEEKQLTIAGEMVGTAYFMSPEQGLAQKVDTRADLYALGATYFYLIMGKYPFEGKTSIEVISKHINEPLPNMFVMKPDIPIWLTKIIEKLMKKDPEERYQSAEEVLKELKKQKARNYENINESTEMNYEMDDLNKKSEAARIQASLKPKNPQTQVPGLVMDHYSSEILETTGDKEKKEAPAKTPAREEKKPKLQFNLLNKLIKTLYHFSALLFSLMVFIFVGGTFQNPENTLVSMMSPFLKWPVPAFGLVLAGLALAAFAVRLKPLKFTPVYAFFALAMIFLAYAGANMAFYPETADSVSRVFFNFKTAVTNLSYSKNLWALALVLLLAAWKLSVRETLYQRILSTFLFLMAFLIFYSYAKGISLYKAEVFEKNWLYSALICTSVAVISNLVKGGMYIFLHPALLTLVAFFSIFHAVEKPEIRRLTDEKENREAALVAQDRRMAALAFQMENANEMPEYDFEGRPIVKPRKDINKILEEIKPRSREKLEQDSKKEYDERVKNNLFESFRGHGALILLALALFGILNVMFFEELIFYEKMFSE
ncbi:MAG: hypothetical protein COT17_05435 [Elusimicrobia bacterium CG08_land_8_20_14_0_20_51_18]|nr:MAG: hypothetical protein COT17_05435 [Elusimicrobia bacterium CG08_land_8_20_14_0_20_51_18]